MNETPLALVAAIERFFLAAVVEAEAASSQGSPGVWPELCRDAIGGIVSGALGSLFCDSSVTIKPLQRLRNDYF
ncbi:hypothetical protein AR464_13195 [Ralstonia solanacearum]|nr:hypothetical protein CCY86_08315 [Ralstonia solanacearum]OCQ65342.1 hypothetical protein AR464_13195 [Ralstonia solanacearum]OPK61909.1 hypothetical protein B5S37_01930 [Ralstonia solanacearum]